MNTVLDLLAQYWQEIEEHRMLQNLNQRQLAENANITRIATPSLDTDDEVDEIVQLAQDDTIIDRKLKGITITNSINVNAHNRVELLFTKHHFLRACLALTSKVNVR